MEGIHSRGFKSSCAQKVVLTDGWNEGQIDQSKTFYPPQLITSMHVIISHLTSKTDFIQYISHSKIETSNCSPVKKALDKAKQSPFKKRGNFEEESFPKSDSKDYSHSELPKQLMSKMFGLLKEGMFCDAIILSGNTEIRVCIFTNNWKIKHIFNCAS